MVYEEHVFAPEEYVQQLIPSDMVQQQSRLLEESEISGTQYMVKEPLVDSLEVRVDIDLNC